MGWRKVDVINFASFLVVESKKNLPILMDCILVCLTHKRVCHPFWIYLNCILPWDQWLYYDRCPSHRVIKFRYFFFFSSGNRIQNNEMERIWFFSLIMFWHRARRNPSQFFFSIADSYISSVINRFMDFMIFAFIHLFLFPFHPNSRNLANNFFSSEKKNAIECTNPQSAHNYNYTWCLWLYQN